MSKLAKSAKLSRLFSELELLKLFEEANGSLAFELPHGSFWTTLDKGFIDFGGSGLGGGPFFFLGGSWGVNSSKPGLELNGSWNS